MLHRQIMSFYSIVFKTQWPKAVTLTIKKIDALVLYLRKLCECESRPRTTALGRFPPDAAQHDRSWLSAGGSAVPLLDVRRFERNFLKFIVVGEYD